MLDVIFNFCLINPTREMVVFGRTMTVWGLGWGVPGAALGTALATAISGVLTLAILLLRDGPLCIRKPGSWHITKACLQNLWKVGAPLAAERAVLSSAQVLLIRIVIRPWHQPPLLPTVLGVSAESLLATWQAMAFRMHPLHWWGRPWAQTVGIWQKTLPGYAPAWA